MDKIAIVGGSGFIGTRTTKELEEYGHDVTVIDIHRPRHTNKYILADATNYDEIYNALNGEFDCVYMLAAMSDSAENLLAPTVAVDKNIVALSNVLYAMQATDIRKIIFSSTVWVYSVCSETYVNEDTPLPITGSEHIYTTSKLTGEALVRNYCSMYGLKYTILRYGIAYGPGCHPETVLSRFITNALNNEPLTITGSGDIYRNFLNVRDHARGNRLALAEECDNQIINLEGPEPVTIAKVAHVVKSMHGDVDIRYTDNRPGDYKGKVVSNEKSQKLLNWTPTTNFIQGARELYDHIKQQNVNHSTPCR